MKMVKIDNRNSHYVFFEVYETREDPLGEKRGLR